MEINIKELLEKADIRTMKKDIQRLKGSSAVKKIQQTVTIESVKKPEYNTFGIPLSNTKRSFIGLPGIGRKNSEVPSLDKEHLIKIKQNLATENKENQKKEIDIKVVEQQKEILHPRLNQESSTPTTLGIFSKPVKKIEEQKLKPQKKVELDSLMEKRISELQSPDKVVDSRLNQNNQASSISTSSSILNKVGTELEQQQPNITSLKPEIQKQPQTEEMPVMKEKIVTKETPPVKQAATIEQSSAYGKDSPKENKHLVEQSLQGKKYLEEIPLTVKEKLAESPAEAGGEKTKEIQRKKFMEDVEEWMNSSQKDT